MANPVRASDAPVIDGPQMSRRAAATRLKLLDGARIAFEEKGYHATRIVDITDNAGVALGNFYRHFDNKNDIFEEVLRPIFEGMLTSSGRFVNEETARSLEALTERNIRYITYFAKNKKLFRAGYEAAASLSSDHFFQTWFQLREMFFARSRAWLNGLQRSGAIDPQMDVEFLAEALGAMNEHFIHIRVVRPKMELNDAEIETMARNLAEIWWSALFAKDARPITTTTNTSDKNLVGRKI